MKNQFYFLLLFVFLATMGCQSTDNSQAMLQNETDRRQVYNAILEDEAMRNELMAEMRERNMGSGMMGQRGMMGGSGMVGDTTGMADMTRQQVQAHMQQMMALCDTDSTACNEMSSMMLGNRALMGNLMQRMREGGMQQGCLQQMMRQINP